MFLFVTNILIKFTRLALDTPEAKVEKILYQVWKIFPPRLIMTIIGGAKYFTLSERLETNFINGIINVALKSGIYFDDIYLNFSIF